MEWLELFFGAARLGVVVVTLNVRYRESELEYMLNQSGAKLLVTAATSGEMDFEAFYPGFRPRIPSVEHVLFLGGTGAGERYSDLPVDPASDGEVDWTSAEVQPDDPAVILYRFRAPRRPGASVPVRTTSISAPCR